MKNFKQFYAAFLSLGCVCLSGFGASAFVNDSLIKNWQFSKDSLNWQPVAIPHDWAIYGPFDRSVDLQKVAVEQNGETQATWKTARSGGLPFIGKGFYKTTVNISEADLALSHYLLFDGAMSRARVQVNGKFVGFWAYGYNSFHFPISHALRAGENLIEVSLENLPESSRWYPGAGLYRNVHLLSANPVHIPVWGTFVTTPYVSAEYATVNLKIKVDGFQKGDEFDLNTVIVDQNGKQVATDTHHFKFYPGVDFAQNFIINAPALWSPEAPALYSAVTKIVSAGKQLDSYTTRFGVRSVEFRAGKGFFLNGKQRKFRGVCNHHDLGPLGAAVNVAALRHQLDLLKDMGVDAIRTSHNMPAPELVALCDEMGFMMMLEPFDDWGFRPKCKNGYGSIFSQWAERDMVNMLHHYRNNPSVVMWSIGNEVPSQWGPDGLAELSFLQNIVKREDPTRAVTCGMDQFDAVVNNGFAAALDVPGFNYKPKRYAEALPKLPQNFVLGSETASTVSSRGVYHFPVELNSGVMHPDHQSSSYDTEFCYWSNIPEDDFIMDDDMAVCMGQFVWTGFDYLGEPTPYDTDAWPSHSSLFGIIDLASLPKDRFYLYRSQWNKNSNTLHILPHWNWKGREGETTPVYVYTNFAKAELFVNGKSYGVQEKNNSSKLSRYRLMWNDVKYEPGELKVVAFDNAGNRFEKSIKTAGKPHHIVLTPNRAQLAADGDDLVYVTVQVADKDGNIVPTDSREVKFEVDGAAFFRATANGDPTSLRPFHKPAMDLFSGAATVIVQSKNEPGTATLKVSAKGVKPASLTFEVK